MAYEHGIRSKNGMDADTGSGEANNRLGNEPEGQQQALWTAAHSCTPLKPSIDAAQHSRGQQRTSSGMSTNGSLLPWIPNCSTRIELDCINCTFTACNRGQANGTRYSSKQGSIALRVNVRLHATTPPVHQRSQLVESHATNADTRADNPAQTAFAPNHGHNIPCNPLGRDR